MERRRRSRLFLFLILFRYFCFFFCLFFCFFAALHGDVQAYSVQKSRAVCGMTECRERAHEVVCDVPISAKPSIAPTNSPSHARLSFVVIGCFLVGDADILATTHPDTLSSSSSSSTLHTPTVHCPLSFYLFAVQLEQATSSTSDTSLLDYYYPRELTIDVSDQNSY